MFPLSASSPKIRVTKVSANKMDLRRKLAFSSKYLFVYKRRSRDRKSSAFEVHLHNSSTFLLLLDNSTIKQPLLFLP